VPSDPLAAKLAAIRERQHLASDASLGFARIEERHAALIKVAYEDTPRILAVAEDLLAISREWESSHHLHTRERGSDLRQAITRRILGEEGENDGS